MGSLLLIQQYVMDNAPFCLMICQLKLVVSIASLKLPEGDIEIE